MLSKIEKFTKCLENLQRDYLGMISMPKKVSELNNISWFRCDFVQKNKPCILKNYVRHWPAVLKWDSEYLRKTIGDRNITIHITPNGQPNGILKHDGKSYFVMPDEKMCCVNHFLDFLEKPKKNMVCCLKRENHEKAIDFPEIEKDLKDHIYWVTKSFAKKPDIVQFLIEDGRCVTSLQKTPYENFYCILNGTKEFLLIPPSDNDCIPYENYEIASYANVEENSFEIQPENGKIKWIPIDPYDPDTFNYPQFINANIYKVKVRAGDCLYLPSRWYYHIKQTHGCISLNYCYDLNSYINYLSSFLK